MRRGHNLLLIVYLSILTLGTVSQFINTVRSVLVSREEEVSPKTMTEAVKGMDFSIYVLCPHRDMYC